MRVVLDTNVWVSAIRSRRGASFALLEALPQALFRYGLSLALYLEYQEKLIEQVSTGSTPLTEREVGAVLAALARFADPVAIYYSLRPNLKDESDNMVFECAANYGAIYIVTHNMRDFRRPQLTAYEIEPIEPSRFLQIIRSKS